MGKIIKLFLIALLFSMSVQAAVAPDFRNVRWGMSKSDVMHNEINLPDLLYDDQVGYKNISLNKEESILVYNFKDDILDSAAYFFLEEHTNLNLYIDDFMSLKDFLTSKYGNPSQDSMKWNDIQYKDDRLNWGKAVLLGQLECIAVWQTDRTTIVLRLRGKEDHSKVELVNYYLNKTK